MEAQMYQPWHGLLIREEAILHWCYGVQLSLKS